MYFWDLGKLNLAIVVWCYVRLKPISGNEWHAPKIGAHVKNGQKWNKLSTFTKVKPKYLLHRVHNLSFIFFCSKKAICFLSPVKNDIRPKSLMSIFFSYFDSLLFAPREKKVSNNIISASMIPLYFNLLCLHVFFAVINFLFFSYRNDTFTVVAALKRRNQIRYFDSGKMQSFIFFVIFFSWVFTFF